MAEQSETEDGVRITDTLLSFIDFLYAVVFGLVLAETFENVIEKEEKTFLDKSGNILLLIGVFYFLAWDWLHGRLLTIRNPYRRYRRFFIEALIAFCGYGAALDAIGMKVSFLVYIALILLLGALWARFTSKEHPASVDEKELRVIAVWQSVMTGVTISVYIVWRHAVGEKLILQQAMLFVLVGWFFVFIYEAFILRPAGVGAGPGVPFINKQRMDGVRELVLRFSKRRKGGHR